MKTSLSLFAALSLAGASGLSAATPLPVSFEFGNSAIKSIAGAPSSFADTFQVDLLAPTLLGGTVITFSPEDAAAVDIQSAYLKLGSTIVALTPVGTGISPDDDIFGIETWSLAPTSLAVGSWELHVTGQGFGVKNFEGYKAVLNGTTQDVPEPNGLALAALALVGLTAARRRAR